MVVVGFFEGTLCDDGNGTLTVVFEEILRVDDARTVDTGGLISTRLAAIAALRSSSSSEISWNIGGGINLRGTISGRGELDILGLEYVLARCRGVRALAKGELDRIDSIELKLFARLILDLANGELDRIGSRSIGIRNCSVALVLFLDWISRMCASTSR
jgi:hypothetical protein